MFQLCSFVQRYTSPQAGAKKTMIPSKILGKLHWQEHFEHWHRIFQKIFQKHSHQFNGRFPQPPKKPSKRPSSGCLTNQTPRNSFKKKNWLVVSTPLKNISQNGNIPQMQGENKKCFSCHHLEKIYQDDYNPLTYHQVDPQLVVQPWWPYSKCHDGTGFHDGHHVARHPSHIFSQPFQGPPEQPVISFLLHPRKLTWNPNLAVWKMFFPFKNGSFRFHVSFRGCIPKKGSIKIDILPKLNSEFFPWKVTVSPNGKGGSSSNHHFSGVNSLLNFGGLREWLLMLTEIQGWKDFRVESCEEQTKRNPLGILNHQQVAGNPTVRCFSHQKIRIWVVLPACAWFDVRRVFQTPKMMRKCHFGHPK